MRKLKTLLVLFAGSLPASVIKNRLLTRLGHQIHPTAIIDPVILLKIFRIEIGARTHVCSGSIFRNLRGVRMGTDCTMMRWNKVAAVPTFRRLEGVDPFTVGILSLGDDVLITKGHALDCSGGIVMEDRSAIAGRETLVYSHSYDPATHTLSCAPTRIGENALVAGRTTLAMGATLPARSVLAMGGVMMPGATKTETLYGGVPAKPIGDVSAWKMKSLRKDPVTMRRHPMA